MTHRVLVVHDVDGWCYHNRALALRKHAPDDIDVTIANHVEFPEHDWKSFDLIYLLDYMTTVGVRRQMKARGATAPLVVSFNKDANSRQHLWPQVVMAADFTVANNEHRWQSGGKAPRTCCISNGVDLDVYQSRVPIADRPHRVIWTGSSSAVKGKGYFEVIVPLQGVLEADGFECEFRPVDHIDASVKTTSQMVDWYNTASYVLVASETEGTPNTALEALSCGCVLVSTWIANVQEFGRHGANCLIADRNVESFASALRYARQNRESLSAQGTETIQSWSYAAPGHRAQWFYQLWRRVIQDGPGSIPSFSYRSTPWESI